MFVAGSLKILYDLLLLYGFRASKTAEERDKEAAAAVVAAAKESEGVGQTRRGADSGPRRPQCVMQSRGVIIIRRFKELISC